MRYKALFSMLFSLFVSSASANWTKVSDVDYTWGPFNIYHITLFTETGKYDDGIRPLMLTLQYKKPWEGRDFAVSLARTWKNLDIQLPEKETDALIAQLRKNFPDIKPEDTLHYIALEDKGYFILNDKVVSSTFNKMFSDAIVAIWLDPKMDISHQLLDPSYKLSPKVEQHNVEQQTTEPVVQNVIKTDEVVANKETPVGQTQSATTVLEKNEAQNTENVGTEKVVTLEPAQIEKQEKTEKEVAPKESTEELSPKEQIDNPEVFISPIYDDILMLSKHYI